MCFLTSDLTIRNKNQRNLIVRRAGLSSWQILMFIFSPNCRKNAKDCKERVDNPHHAEAEAVKKALVSSLVTKTQLSEKEVPPIAD